jgi:hypothetical protein
MTALVEPRPSSLASTEVMRAAVFHGPNDIRVAEVPRPHPGPGKAVIRVTLTTICGTDVHILKGEYPVRPGLVVGHEPVGVIDELGAGVTGYYIGQRVLVGAQPVRPMLRLPVRPPEPVRPWRRLRRHRRLALRQHHRRCAGRVPARAGGAGEPRPDPGRLD